MNSCEFDIRLRIANEICQYLNDVEDTFEDLDLSNIALNDLILLNYSLSIAMDIAKKQNGDKKMRKVDIAEVLILNVFENEFQDEKTNLPVKWYYTNVLLDDEMVRMKVNSKKVEELMAVQKRKWIMIEYQSTSKLISEDGTKYETQFEFLGIVPFSDIDTKKDKKGDKQ